MTPSLRKLAGMLPAALICVAMESAWSCSPGAGYRPKTVEEKALLAEVVIQGRATSNYGAGSKVFEVSKWLKGSGPTTVLVTGFGSSSLCLTDILLDVEVVIFASVERATGYMALSYTGVHDAVDDATAAAKVLAAIRSQPRTP